MATECEFPLENAFDRQVREILSTAKAICVVGLSDRPERPSFRVASYLKEQGYRIFPVNPNIAGRLGQIAYPHLRDVPEPVDVVDIFRRPQAVPEIVEAAISIEARVIWMQEGIVHNKAAQRARQAGLLVVMNKCMMKEHRKIST